ncbi:MAG TPA: magnesium transporter, partial [Hyphomicrobium sp.]|nr:magnesium transporter [Hyphomicrobium sp.]
MVENHNSDTAPDAPEAPSMDLIRSVADALHSHEDAAAADLVKDLKAPDLADVIELLEPDDRITLIESIGPSFDFEVLSELDESVRDQVSEGLPNALLAKAVTHLDTDDAAYVIESLEES